MNRKHINQVGSGKINRRGFTIIELLVVVGIITALAGISYPIVTRQVDAGRKIETLSLAKDLALGVELFHEDIQELPHDQGQLPTVDQAYSSGGDDPSSHIISHLLGQNASINKDKNNYLDFIRIKDNGKAGLVKANVNGNSNSQNSNATIKGLHDSWGNEYLVIFDHDYDDDVIAPSSIGSNGNNNGNNGNNGNSGNEEGVSIDSYAGDIWRNCNMVIISAGKDGMFDKINDIVYTSSY